MEYLHITNIVLFFVFLINAGLGLFVFIKRITQKRIRISFSILSWTLASWNLSILMIFLVKNPSWKFFWGRMSFAAASVAPFAFFAFSLFFPKEKWIISNKRLFLMCIPSAVFIILSFTELMVRSVRWDTMTTDYGPIYPFFGIFVSLSIIGGLFFC